MHTNEPLKMIRKTIRTSIKCTIDQELPAEAVAAGHKFRVHSPYGNTFSREMTLWSPSWKCDLKSKIRNVDRCPFTWRTIRCQISSWSGLYPQSQALWRTIDEEQQEQQQ